MYEQLYIKALSPYFFFFFFNDTATTEIYTLSLHDALPICPRRGWRRARPAASAAGWAPARGPAPRAAAGRPTARAETSLHCRPGPPAPAPRPRARPGVPWEDGDRKSTRLNSSHLVISYAVF